MRQKHLLKSLLLLLAILAGSSAWAADETITFSEKGYTNAEDVNEVNGTDFTIVFSNGSNNYNTPKYYTTGTAVRAYGGNTMTVSSATKTITEIVLTFASGEGSNAITTDPGTYSNGTWTGSASSIVFTVGGTTGHRRIVSVAVTYGDSRTATTVTIDATGITNTDFYSGTAAGSLAATVTAGEEAITGAKITWASENEEVATIDANGAVTLVGAGTAKITASFAGDETYRPSTATHTLTVTNSDPNAPGTENNPYTVADAINFINTLGSATSTEEVYVHGIISKIDSYNSKYKSITYWISDDGTTTNQMEVYSGKGLDGADFSSKDDLAVGDIVTVKGKVKMFNTTPEFDSNNVLTSLVQKPAAPTFSPAGGTYTAAQSVTISTATDGAAIYYTVDGTEPTAESTLYSEAIAVNTTTTIKAIAVKDGLNSEVAKAEYVIDLTPRVTVSTEAITASAAGADGTIEVAYNNISTVVAEVQFYEADGITEATCNWVEAVVNSSTNNVDYIIEANNSDARTAYMKVRALDDNKKYVFSELITITQAKFEVDYATLPFEFDGEKAAIETTTGLTQSGLGSDYKSSPSLKFDSTDDYVILKFNERPGKLSFIIKGNSFNGGKFTVQTSADGQTYNDLKTYSTNTINNGFDEVFENLDAGIRYIKWVYTEKSSGNVALGSIKLEKVDTNPSITVAQNAIEATAEETTGTIAVTYKNITDVVAELQFCDADGNAADYNWVVAEINTDNNIDYTIGANTGEARTAYMKVFALDNNTNEVYSEIITITQAAYVAPFEAVNYTLATTITSGKHYIITSEASEGSAKAMGGQGNNNRAAVEEEVEVENDVARVTSSEVREFIIYGPDAKGYYTIYDEKEGGYLYAASSSNNILRTSKDLNNNGKWSIEFDDNGVATIMAQGTYTHNVMKFNSSNSLFSCYVSSASQEAICLYEKQGEATPTETVTVTDAKYATYCSENALDFSNSGVTAYIAKKSADNKVTFETVTKVPAYTGVLLKAEADGNFTANATSSVDDVNGNALIGVTKKTEVSETGIYVLMNEDEGIGFYRTTSAFTLGAHTAYLPALADNTRSFIAIDEATAIKGIAAETETDGAVYNLQGQRVTKAGKGLYIIGGKKVLVK